MGAHFHRQLGSKAELSGFCQPWEWSPSTKCNNDLGLEHLKIRDSSLTASSHSSYESLSHGECKAVGGYPSCARLNNNVCSWCVKGVGEQYLQVDFGNCTTVSGVETQGAEGCTKDYYVRKYKVSYKRDGQTWLFYPLVIKGNRNGNSRERYNFNPPLYTRYIRIHPTAYRNMICLRMELYGCPNSCSSLRTTPSAKILSGANSRTPKNVPPTAGTTLRGANYTKPRNVTRATAPSSTEEKTIIIQSTTGQPVGSGNILTLPSEKHTGKVTAQMANDEFEKHSSKPWSIAFVLVFYFCLLLWFICIGKKNTERNE
ncbi:PREDICTED: lactadherin-like [Acropora digitifera]|uniref:lactadherin-like n=1 Tax=Acropora digitifera TaxID=70779 RepID=UPI00077A07EC|nr:PREDICTED: lactadherin-like [Acropora digitifera]